MKVMWAHSLDRVKQVTFGLQYQVKDPSPIFIVDMMEYMQDYGVDAHTTEVAFLEDELEDSDFEHDHANENI